MNTRAVSNILFMVVKKVTLIENRAGVENKMLCQKYIAQIAQNFRRLFMSARFTVFKKVYLIAFVHNVLVLLVLYLQVIC